MLDHGMWTELHIIALSGGKDSTAMALRLKELNPDIDYQCICTPTGNELPDMFAHWRMLKDRLGNLQAIMGGTLDSCIEEQNMIPNWRARFCTRKLKIDPYASWLIQQQENYDIIYSYVGIRYDEPEREAGDYSHIPGVEMVFPLRQWKWGIKDVLKYLVEQNITIPARTDCALCFFQRLGEWWALWKNHPKEYQHGVDIEEKMGHTFRSPSRDTWPASLKELREEFEKGREPRGVKDGKIIGQCRVCRL